MEEIQTITQFRFTFSFKMVKYDPRIKGSDSYSSVDKSGN